MSSSLVVDTQQVFIATFWYEGRCCGDHGEMQEYVCAGSKREADEIARGWQENANSTKLPRKCLLQIQATSIPYNSSLHKKSVKPVC
jgi:hypothetical protein